VAGWPVPSAGQKIPLQPGWYLPPQKIPFVENRFLLAGKGAENTKEKFRHCFPPRGRVVNMSFEGMATRESAQVPKPESNITLDVTCPSAA